MRRNLQVVHHPDADCPKIPRCRLLDTPTSCPSILWRLMAHVLDQYHIMAQGPSAAYYGVERTVNGNPERGRLLTDTDPDGPAALERRFWEAPTNRRRLEVIREAQDVVRRYAVADRSKVRDTPEWEAAIAKDPRPHRTLAKVYGVSLRRTVAIKRAARAVVIPKGRTPVRQGRLF